MITFIIFIITAYLLGAIPTSIWYGRIFHGTDIRLHGSGNAGATNTFRTFGKKAGIIVLLIDILKGVIAVLQPLFYKLITGLDLELTFSSFPELTLGFSAAIGHVYPIYEKFKGGKGVATLFGVVVAMSPTVGLICFAFFACIFILTRLVSLGSVLGSILFLVSIIWIHKLYFPLDITMAVLYTTLLIYTHRSNIKRLLKGEEPQMKFGKK